MKRIVPLFPAVLAAFALGGNYETDHQIWLDAISKLEPIEMNEAAVLFARCDKMTLVIEDLPKAVLALGLRRDTLRDSMESRLRSSGLLSPKPTSQYLYLNINGIGKAFSLSLELKRPLDTGYGFKYGAVVWSSGAVMENSDDHNIRGEATNHLDAFLNRYLRANQIACDHPEQFAEPELDLSEAASALHKAMFPNEESRDRWIEYLNDSMDTKP